MSVRRPIQSSARKSGSQIQPWHILVILIAVAVLGWRLVGYIGEARRNADVKYSKGEVKNPAPPGTGMYRAFEEK